MLLNNQYTFVNLHCKTAVQGFGGRHCRRHRCSNDIAMCGRLRQITDDMLGRRGRVTGRDG
jgi:hypothetical protein